MTPRYFDGRFGRRADLLLYEYVHDEQEDRRQIYTRSDSTSSITAHTNKPNFKRSRQKPALFFIARVALV
jgi:hypothetical protein